MGVKFQKNVEDFACEHCGTSVEGSGYTNHCPKCLWSKHVDVYPGDRAEVCGGMMEPKLIEGTTDHYVIVHRCSTCGMERRQRVSRDDSADALVALAAKRKD